MARRRYGYRHAQIRAALLPEAWGELCLHCGRVMHEDQALDLDHRADGDGYRGMVHATCNRREGARRGNAAKRRKAGGGVFAPGAR
jgi:hypothetical protein